MEQASGRARRHSTTSTTPVTPTAPPATLKSTDRTRTHSSAEVNRRLKMKNRYQSIIEQFARTLAGVAAWTLLLFGAIAFAQSSVEKVETSQQARAPESELDRARAIVTKPGENKPDKPETGRVWGVYSTTTTFEIGHRFVDTDGSRDRYLSDVNVRDGWRVLEYSTDMRAQPGSGLLFDFLKAEVSNAGGDQSQTFSLRMDKARAYRFDGNIRRFNYYRSPGS